MDMTRIRYMWTMLQIGRSAGGCYSELTSGNTKLTNTGQNALIYGRADHNRTMAVRNVYASNKQSQAA